MNNSVVFIVIGNVIFLLGNIVLVTNGLVADKKKFLKVQCLQCSIFIVASFFLGAYASIINNVLGIIRNVLFIKDKSGYHIAFIISVINTTLTILCTDDVFSILILISSISYNFGMIKLKTDKSMKKLSIFTLSLWLIYDFAYLNIVGGCFDLFAIITNSITLYKLRGGYENGKA